MKNVTNERSQSKSLLAPERYRAQTKYNIRIYTKNAYLYKLKISLNFLFILNKKKKVKYNSICNIYVLSI